MKKIVTALFLMIMLFLMTGCSSKDTLEGVYSPEKISHGYKFDSDGLVTYYDTNWKKMPLGEGGCDPTFTYGTYTRDGKALTIKLSGVDHDIIGVILSDDLIMIDGESSEKLTEPYSEYGESESWAELGRALGME